MKKNFLPAAHWDFLTPVYDPFMRFFWRDTVRKIADIVSPKAGQKILDAGCGPGNLIVELKKRSPDTYITGLDMDPKILAVADRKIKENSFVVSLVEASAAKMPFPDNTFDAVTSTLMIHHLTSEERKEMVREAYRVLKPGGNFFLYDFGPPKSAFWRIFSKIIGLFEDVSDGISGNYAEFLKQAGFVNIHSAYRTNMFELLCASK